MGHFRLDEWADFARGLVDDARRSAMRRHLDGGCSDCGGILQTWKRVGEVGRRESLYEPPDAVLRSVKGAYAIYGRPAARSGLTIMARLVFDSFSGALPVGVRSAETSARQLLYQSEPYEIDVRLQPQHDSENFSLIGQVLASEKADYTVDEIPVALIENGKTLVESVTNAFGEFRLECDLNRSLQLRFEPSPGSYFYIPLTEAVSRESSAGSNKGSKSSPPAGGKRGSKP